MAQDERWTARHRRSHPARLIGGFLGLLLAIAGFGGCGSAKPAALHIGAVFPLQGAQSPLGKDELRGVEAAVRVANSLGGVHSEKVVLDVQDMEEPGQASAVVAGLRRDPVVIGAYSSQLSVPLATATAARRMVYWEAGAVADQLTGAGSPWVFRVGATGTDLGSNSAAFTAADVSPRLGLSPNQTRVSVVWEDDAYGDSVAAGAIRQAKSDGMSIVSQTTYDSYRPDWPKVLDAVRSAHPDVLILASYIPDGVAFRRAMLAAHLSVGAFIGSTMSECVPSFASALGADAIGVFGSDRPDGSFNARSLDPSGLYAYNRLAVELGRAPTEEELSGFTAAWALLRDVLPRASDLSSPSIAAAARQVNLPVNDLPNGAGLEFSAASADLGQNLRAAAMIWQWQAPGRDVVVWPPDYATGRPALIPLPQGVATAVSSSGSSDAW